ncbi:helix-turn-helix domain-containing protein [Duganella sp. P38]|uniref:helix-turn-helix domain-containing protein n=1 Tax=Duganella sp. P38 TaxID=3423949 RepID=UPI003D796F8E
MSALHPIRIPDEPGDAMAAALALRELADQVERNAVRKALDDGWTWAQIAEALGVTRQAAHKKHAASMARN